MHPSWEAKIRQKKIMEQAKSIQGTKINFHNQLCSQLRVVELKHILLYGMTLTQNRFPTSGLKKSLLVESLAGQFKFLYDAKQRENYQNLLGCTADYSRFLFAHQKYQWYNTAIKFPNTNGPWAVFNQSSRPPPTIDNTRVSATTSSTGGPIQATVVAPVAVPTGTAANAAAAAVCSTFDRVEFCESPFTMPIKNVCSPIIFMETRGRTHTKKIQLKLTADLVDTLTESARTPGAAEYGIYWYMCDYAEACQAANRTPKRPVRVAFPQTLTMLVNSKAILQQHFQALKANFPANVNEHIIKSTDLTNSVHVNYNSNSRWVGVLALTKLHSVQSMSRDIRKNSYVAAEDVRKLFFKGSGVDDDDLISTGALVSLKCPLGLSRIRTPSRSKFCQHTQCFDCETFLQMNRQVPTFKCPVCSSAIKSWRELIVDGYFDAILQSTSTNDDQVYIEADGTWKSKRQMETVQVESHSAKRQALEIVVDEFVGLSDSISLHGRPPAKDKRPRVDYIDLTLDSDDDHELMLPLIADDDHESTLPPITDEDIELIEAMISSSNSSSRSNSESEADGLAEKNGTASPIAPESAIPAEIQPAAQASTVQPEAAQASAALEVTTTTGLSRIVPWTTTTADYIASRHHDMSFMPLMRRAAPQLPELQGFPAMPPSSVVTAATATATAAADTDADADAAALTLEHRHTSEFERMTMPVPGPLPKAKRGRRPKALAFSAADIPSIVGLASVSTAQQRPVSPYRDPILPSSALVTPGRQSAHISSHSSSRMTTSPLARSITGSRTVPRPRVRMTVDTTTTAPITPTAHSRQPVIGMSPAYKSLFMNAQMASDSASSDTGVPPTASVAGRNIAPAPGGSYPSA
ncbi:E3 SUMO-protein ligase pli1 [Kickxella alabastrina]|uniref:E3 SUMO-protein ligase pli1 n=1 Tax=Kickxella alabastrina TaxID=61397 RepID=A0ACC1I3N6_9FUNG|nr:E3 SUMO-protein ligase pli1 [Kickxella alabastrina]